jgi:hypothetical protein
LFFVSQIPKYLRLTVSSSLLQGKHDSVFVEAYRYWHCTGTGIANIKILPAAAGKKGKILQLIFPNLLVKVVYVDEGCHQVKCS